MASASARIMTTMPERGTATSPLTLTKPLGWKLEAALLFAWALCMGIAFPRTSLWPLAHVALLALGFAALRTDRPRRLALLTFAVALPF